MIDTITVVIILFRLLYRGLNQSKGKASGPAHKNPIITQFVLKYHCALEDLFKNSPQYLHLTASSCMSSAQKGHFFIIYSRC